MFISEDWLLSLAKIRQMKSFNLTLVLVLADDLTEHFAIFIPNICTYNDVR